VGNGSGGARELGVLVVDDDPDVLEIAAAAFERAGCTVHQAADGIGALDILKSHPEIGLLFSDIVMPGMSGIELAREAAELRPGLMIVLATGYASSFPASTLPVLKKPFRFPEIRRIVDALRAAPEGGCASNA
jgi:CheY-like chemotaxis protein